MKFKNIALGILFLAVLISCGKGASDGKIASEKPSNPTPLGLEIHYANIDGVKSKYKDVDFEKSKESNEFTGGVELTANGDGFGVSGLKGAIFTFNKEGILEHVGLVLHKDVLAMDENLSSKYEVVSKDINTFLGYGNAQYSSGDTVIQLISDHLSFDMKVLYTYRPLFEKAQGLIQEQEKRSDAEQKSKF